MADFDQYESADHSHSAPPPPEQRVWVVSAEQFDALEAMLDAPVKPDPKLQALFAMPTVFDNKPDIPPRTAEDNRPVFDPDDVYRIANVIEDALNELSPAENFTQRSLDTARKIIAALEA